MSLYPNNSEGGSLVSTSIKRPRGYKVGKTLSDTNIEKRKYTVRKYSMNSNHSDHIHKLFQDVENELQTMLYKAILRSNYDKVKKMFLKNKLHSDRIPNINHYYANNNTPLHISVHRGDLEMCNLILDLDAAIDKENSNGRTPLHVAVLYHRTEIIDLLLSAGANLNLQDCDMNTPLMIATIRGFSDIVEILLIHEADISFKNDHGEKAYELIPNVATRNIYHQYLPKEEIDANQSGYNRTVIQGYMRKNNRRDMTECLLNKTKIFIDLQRNNSQFKPYLDDMYLPGKLKLNNFIIHELLGKGGFGEVYLVQQKKTNNYYALKALEKKRVMKETSKKYVINERAVYEQFNSPFITKFYRAFQSNNYLYLLCEYAQFGDLKAYIKKFKPFSESDAKIAAAQVLLALEHLHKKGIIYRDLKPENILIGNEGFIKLADFGLCKENIYGNTDTNSFCGSIAYLTPEIILRKGHGRAVDWYLLGAVLYEMIIGIPPYYTRRGREAVLENIKFGELKFHDANVSDEYMSVVRMLLDRDVNKRLGSGPTDSEEIKQHPFFNTINFEAIYYHHFVPPKIFMEKIEKNSSTNPLNESQWYCNKELKNDMKQGNTEANINHIDNWNFEGFDTIGDK